MCAPVIQTSVFWMPSSTSFQIYEIGNNTQKPLGPLFFSIFFFFLSDLSPEMV